MNETLMQILKIILWISLAHTLGASLLWTGVNVYMLGSDDPFRQYAAIRGELSGLGVILSAGFLALLYRGERDE